MQERLSGVVKGHEWADGVLDRAVVELGAVDLWLNRSLALSC